MGVGLGQISLDADATFYPRRAAWYTDGMSTEKPEQATIEVRQTPNPNARKFVLAGVRFDGSHNYALGQVVDHPLAAQLLALEGVYNVLLAQDFVTVNKVPHVEWPPLQAAVERLLRDFLSQDPNRLKT
jgi:hypothetical protein